MDANVGKPLLADMAERLGDAVEKWFATDEPMVGEQVRAMGEVLARMPWNRAARSCAAGRD